MKNGVGLFAFLGICAVLIGCATGSTIVTGKVRAAIDPAEVNIYVDPPSQYETIGMVEASSEVEFSRQKAQDRVMDELKSRAAKIGANGVLLINTGSQPSGEGTAITVQARAIFVIQE